MQLLKAQSNEILNLHFFHHWNLGHVPKDLAELFEFHVKKWPLGCRFDLGKKNLKPKLSLDCLFNSFLFFTWPPPTTGATFLVHQNVNLPIWDAIFQCLFQGLIHQVKKVASVYIVI